MSRNRRRVVVTGLGIISPVGIGKEAFWDSLVKGRSGIKRISKFDASQYPCQVAGEVDDFDPLDYMDRKEAKRMDRSTQFAVSAGKMAIEDARLRLEREDPKRVGVAIGTTMAGAAYLFDEHSRSLKHGVLKINPITASATFPNACSSWVSMICRAEGPSKTFSTACTSSFDAVCYGFDIIREHGMDLVLAGGTEVPLHPMLLGTVYLSKILSERDGGMKTPRPFDVGHDGTVLSEGAGVLVLEELEHALNRNAPIYAEILGYGMTCDASHMVSPNYQGIANTMDLALREADLPPEDVDYIHAHGSATPAGDLAETLGIKAIFGRYAYRIPISSIKSMVGHMMGAAGAIELSACILALTHGVIPPTINHEYPDPDCDLDYVPNKARVVRIRRAIANCFGFGGKNTAVVLEKAEEICLSGSKCKQHYVGFVS